MATASTSTSLSDHSVSKSLPKLRPLELSNNETFYLEGDLIVEFYSTIFTRLQTLSPYDKNIREFLTIVEAQNRMTRRNEADEEESDSSEEQQIPVVYGPLMISKKDIMTELEFRLFIFNLWLRRIELIRQTDTKKYNSLPDFKNAIDQAQQATKDYREFIHKQFYNMKPHKMLPQDEEIHEKAWEKTLKEMEKADFEMLDEDLEKIRSNTAYLCALLGLRLDFLDRLKKIPPKDRDHLKTCDWIITLIRNNYKSESRANGSSLSKELLVSIGFDPQSSSAETIMRCAGSTQHHIDACEMAEIFIRDQFKYNSLLSPEDSRFPLGDNNTNIWFQLPEQTSDEENDEVPVCHINIQNLVTLESLASSNIRESLDGLVTKEDQNTVLFHGTDHQSACDILFRGIDLNYGRQNRDFSHRSGFYLTKDSEMALNWAKTTTAKPALLVFQVNRQEHLDNAKKLNLFENDQKWREIVSSFRSGRKTAMTRESLCAYDLIEGPVGIMRTNDLTNEIMFEPKPSSYQMCLISDDFAETFRKTLHSIIFLDIC